MKASLVAHARSCRAFASASQLQALCMWLCALMHPELQPTYHFAVNTCEMTWDCVSDDLCPILRPETFPATILWSPWCSPLPPYVTGHATHILLWSPDTNGPNGGEAPCRSIPECWCDKPMEMNCSTNSGVHAASDGRGHFSSKRKIIKIKNRAVKLPAHYSGA